MGYDGRILIRDIDIHLEKGKILTLIGPNGAGKSTILKTITRQLKKISGGVYIDSREIDAWSTREMARQTAVVLTDRIRPELMTCREVVAMGRYPYTDLFGRCTATDDDAVQEALERVCASDLAEQDFMTLSDGQRQRIMLARAICQEPALMVLDEPTAYLDIHHKLALLNILRELAKEKGLTVILSLHEIDLAAKVSDCLLCVKGDTVAAFGPPEEILRNNGIEALYGLRQGAYNALFGSVELAKPEGAPRVFVVAGGGYGIPCYRALQKQEIPFATGILFSNDVDAQVANALSDHVVSAPQFSPMGESHLAAASALLLQCRAVIDAGTPRGELNRLNGQLLKLAGERDIPIYGRAAAEEGKLWNR